ncbi:MAG: cupin domain-containing protein, partial [Dermatophilaceae bacterium]
MRLDAGQLALVPRGIGHRVSASPGARARGRADELPQTMLGEAFFLVTFGEPGAEAARDPVRRGRLRLPRRARPAGRASPVVRVDSARHPVMASLLPLLAEELRVPRPGGDAVATRLADVLVIETVRS